MSSKSQVTSFHSPASSGALPFVGIARTGLPACCFSACCWLRRLGLRAGSVALANCGFGAVTGRPVPYVNSSFAIAAVEHVPPLWSSYLEYMLEIWCCRSWSLRHELVFRTGPPAPARAGGYGFAVYAALRASQQRTEGALSLQQTGIWSLGLTG